MKAKTLFLILLSSLLVVGCKNKSEENNEPTPPEPTFTKITEEQVKSYFPYAVNDQIVFRGEGWSDHTYTVKESSFTNKAGKMNLAVSMTGRDTFISSKDTYTIELKAEVTDNKILKIDFLQYLNIQPSSKTTGTYTYDASKNDSLPEKIVLTNGAIVQKDKGLVYYEDYDSYKLYFSNRL